MEAHDPHRWLTTREAHDLVATQLGRSAPTWETFRAWVRPSGAERGIRPAGFPDPIRVPGSNGHIWDRRELERWLETVMPETAAERSA